MSELMKIAAGETPAKRGSKLDPHLADLQRLQREGYSLKQLKSFLKGIGIEVARQSIYDFLKRRESVTAQQNVGQVIKDDGVKTEEKSVLTQASREPPPSTIRRSTQVADTKAAVKELLLNPDLSLSDDTYEAFKKKD